MAIKRQKQNGKPSKTGRIPLIVFLVLLMLLVLLSCIGAVNASVVRIHRAEVELCDLPPVFDGIKLLYASDIDLCGWNTPDKSGILFERLQSLEPDILLLGGDYTSPSLLKILNRPENSGIYDSEFLRARSDFLRHIQSFEAPLGKYAIASPEDPDWETLQIQISESGIHSLINDRISIELEGDRVWLAGISQESSSLNSAGNLFTSGDCVLVAAYGPSVLPVLLTSEASDGGQWADLVLCGHTHGGQLRLFGRSLLSLTSQERQFLSGWQIDNGLPILTSSGVGCEGVNIRLGTAPEVWLITLRTK